MTQNTSLRLWADFHACRCLGSGDEIWQVGLADAIGHEADAIASAATAELVGGLTQSGCANASPPR